MKDCQQKSGLFAEIDNIYKTGDTILCSATCPCTADPSLFQLDVQPSIIYDKLGADDVLDCPMDAMTDEEEGRLKGLLAGLETDFQCAGACTIPKFFLFSDVAAGPP